MGQDATSHSEGGGAQVGRMARESGVRSPDHSKEVQT